MKIHILVGNVLVLQTGGIRKGSDPAVSFFTIMNPNILVAKQIPSYVKGTNNFINEINDIGSFLPNSYLVTIYVKLYMPNSEGIQAV